MDYACQYRKILWGAFLMTPLLMDIIATMAVKGMQTEVNALLLPWVATDVSAHA